MPADNNFWGGFASRADRRRARADVVLTDVGVTTATLNRYYYAVSRLTPVLEAVNTDFELDKLVADWIQQEFEDGTPLYLIADALSGLHHFEPYTRRKLVKSWRLYGIWRKFEVPCRAPPLPQDILLAMSGYCLQEGDLIMSALLLIGFHCLLRTGELLAIRPADFLVGPDHGLVTLPSSKSGLRNNSKESVSITDPTTLEVTKAMLEAKTALGLHQTPCWDFSGSAFRSRFAAVLKALEVHDLNFKPYSLRRGGATWEMQQHGSMERVLVRGRWKTSTVARLYIADGLSLLPSLRMTWSAKHLVAKFSAVYTAEHRSFCNGNRGKRRRV